MKKIAWKKIFALFLVWRLLLLLLAVLAPGFFNYQPSFVAPESLSHYGLPAWLANWAGFDGVHYLSIAREGYKTIDLIQAFFPVYPLSIRYLSLFFQNPLLSALIISNLATIICLILIDLLFREKLVVQQTF